ncbi:sulfatase-like hydrolase/transferase, partial [Candidatus Sumerlaeota bacterium]|nr:sulfatase-like hydrolase/transferase [Candidatus Sumerlaeota bacterium]
MRRFIAVPIFVCFLLLVHSLPAADPQRPPNILFIIGDDHAPYVFGAYGNAKARTPHLDQFASTALRFDRAYCNSPVCTASRQSFLTGRLPHSIGVTLLKTPLGEDPVTLAELLKPLGYATAACGKMHFNSEKRHGFEVIYDRSEPRAKLPAVREDFPFKVQPPWKPFRDPADVWLNSACLPQGTHIEDMPGTMIAERAVDFMREHKDGPFLLFASFHEPHSPFYFPVEYRGMFKPEDFIPPEIGPEDADQIPAIFRGLTPEQKRGIIAAYY